MAYKWGNVQAVCENVSLDFNMTEKYIIVKETDSSCFSGALFSFSLFFSPSLAMS